MRQHGNFLRDGVHIKTFHRVDAVQTVTAVVNRVCGDLVRSDCLRHEQRRGRVVDRQKDELAVLELFDLLGEIRIVGIGKDRNLHRVGNLASHVLAEQVVNALGVRLVGLIEHADLRRLVFPVANHLPDVFRSHLALITVGKAHLVAVRNFRDFIVRSGRGHEEEVVALRKALEFQRRFGRHATERHLRTLFEQFGIVGCNLIRIVRVIQSQQSEFHAVQSARLVDLVNRHLRGVPHRLAVERRAPAERSGHSDDEFGVLFRIILLPAGRKSRRAQDCRQCRRQKLSNLFHVCSLSFLWKYLCPRRRIPTAKNQKRGQLPVRKAALCPPQTVTAWRNACSVR